MFNASNVSRISSISRKILNQVQNDVYVQHGAPRSFASLSNIAIYQFNSHSIFLPAKVQGRIRKDRKAGRFFADNQAK